MPSAEPAGHAEAVLRGLGGAEPTAAGGLIGLVDRVQALGGILTITSSPGAGTALAALLPLIKEGHAEGALPPRRVLP
jgi:hypothetical protein